MPISHTSITQTSTDNLGGRASPQTLATLHVLKFSSPTPLHRLRVSTMRIRGCIAALVVWALLLGAGAEYAPFDDAVPMSKLGQMQFHRGQDTTFKRSSPIPQLRCVRGCEFEPAVVQCTNVKPRENKSKWRCETDLPRHLKFDETTIICEGFEHPTDNKVLKGSCGLEYSLTSTGWSPLQGQHYKHYMAIAEEDEMKGWTASWMIVIGVVLYLIHHNWRSFNFADPNGGIAAQVSRARHAWGTGQGDNRSPRGNSKQSAR